MSVKITKEMSNKLIKYVTKVDIRYNPLDGRTASAREVLRQLKCDRFKQANPKMKIKEEFQFTAKPPYVSIGFVDGSDVQFKSKDYECNEMLQEMYLHIMNIDYDYEINNKTLDM